MRPPLQPPCLENKSCAVATTGSPMKKLCCLSLGLQQWIRNISAGVESQKKREYCCCKNCWCEQPGRGNGGGGVGLGLLNSKLIKERVQRWRAGNNYKNEHYSRKNHIFWGELFSMGLMMQYWAWINFSFFYTLTLSTATAEAIPIKSLKSLRPIAQCFIGNDTSKYHLLKDDTQTYNKLH